MSFDKSLVGQARTTMAEGDRAFVAQVVEAKQAVGQVTRALTALSTLQAALTNAQAALGVVGTNLPQTDVRPYQGAIATAHQAKERLTREAADLDAALAPVVASLNASVPHIAVALETAAQQFSSGVRSSDAELGLIQNS